MELLVHNEPTSTEPCLLSALPDHERSVSRGKRLYLLFVVNVANFDSFFSWNIFDLDFFHVLSSCDMVFAADFALVAPCRAFAVLSAVVLPFVLVH